MNIKRVSIRIIAMFSVAILISFIPEMFPDFFGDWSCNGCNYGEAGYSRIHKPSTHWGYRHYLFFIMGAVLFIVQTIDIINKEQ